MDKLDCMRAFKQVVDCGGYAAAARAMGLTRSTVNKHVSFLEAELQTQLLVRSTRKVRATESGLAFYDRCTELLSNFDEAVAAVGQLQATPQGKLRINAPMSYGTMHLSAVVAEFMARYPALHIELALSDRKVDPIEEGFDVTIRISTPQMSSSLLSREIAISQGVVCASPDYLRRHGTPWHPDELIQHRCLQYGFQTSGSYWQLHGPDGDLSVPITCAMWSNNGEVLRDAAVQHGGIASLPVFIAQSALDDGRLIEVLPQFKPPDRVICAIYPRHRHLSSKVRLFVDFIAVRLAVVG